MKYTLLLLIIHCTFLYGIAQDKFEVEYKIEENEVPEKAIDFLQQFGENLKVKWYGEESQEGKSIEAKVKFNEKLHSIEFDTLGYLQDVEIDLKENELTKDVLDAINTELRNEFKKHQLNKIQVQYSGPSNKVLHFLTNNTQDISIVKRYELIVKGKIENEVNLYEITFDEYGALLTKKRIIFKNSDHLEY